MAFVRMWRSIRSEQEETEKRRPLGSVRLHNTPRTGILHGTRRGRLETESCPSRGLHHQAESSRQPSLFCRSRIFFSIFIFFNMCKDKPGVCSYQTLEN